MKRIQLVGLLLALLLAGCTTWKTAYLEAERLEVDTGLQDSLILAMIQPYKAQLDEEMGEVIARAEADMPKARPESALGNMMTDIIYAEAAETLGVPIAFALQNYGGIRIPLLPAGPVTRGKIYELMPFENYLVAVRLDSTRVMQLVEYMAAANGWPVSAQLRYEIHKREPVKVRIKGEAVKGGRDYWVAMPDYVANGGDKTYFLKGADRKDSGSLIRDVLLKHLAELHRRGKPIPYVVDGRVVRLEE